MAVGDIFNAGPSSVADDAYLDLKPSSGEVAIHNIVYNGAVELYFYDGTNLIGPLSTDGGVGWTNDVHLNCTTTKYYRVKNKSGGAQFIAADGKVTK
jgi:hypothetical protein